MALMLDGWICFYLFIGYCYSTSIVIPIVRRKAQAPNSFHHGCLIIERKSQ